jgi:single-strand DNA-binding protein
MRGIETAFEGTLGRDPELKTSKAGKPFASLALAVVTGKADAGGDAATWIRATVFGETAEEIAATVKKGDRVYCEGSLTMSQWNDAHGEVRHGLNVAAWRCKPLGLIGERKPKSNKPATSTKARKPATRSHGGNGAGNNGAESKGAKYDHDFNDDLPF